MTRIATVLGLAVLVLLALAPALAAGFVWDDGPLILDNPAVKNPRLLPQLLTSSFWQTGDRDDRFRSFFRPLVSASYAADYAAWGPNALGFHLTNLLLHFGCVLLVYRIATREKLPGAAAFCGAALFAVHPVHVESVAWICGRTDVIATLLVLAAFLVHRRAEESEVPRWLAAGLLFLPALFAKEVAATLPAIVALDRWLRTEGEPKRIGRALRAALPFALALAVYVGVRSIVLRGGAELLHLGPLEWASTAAFVLARYLTLLVLPVSLDAHYPYAALDGLHDPLAIVGLLMVAIVAVAAVVLFRRSRADAFWLLWIPITLAPVMLFGRFGDVLMADRFLYLPSVGLAILFGRGCALTTSFESRARRAVPLFACSLAIGALAWTSADRTHVWNDDVTLFSDMARTSPRSALVHANLGMALYRRDQPAQAIEELRLAIQLVPAFAMAHNDLGAALERMGDNTGAEDHYRAALRQAPGLVSAEANLAHLLVESGRTEEGVRRLRRLDDKRPNSPDVLFAAGDAAKQVGAYEEALGYVERLLRVEPRNARAFYLRGQIQLDQGRQAEAVASMRRFLELYSKPGPHVDAARRVVAGEPVSRL